jgi:hypothetical protein
VVVVEKKVFVCRAVIELKWVLVLNVVLLKVPTIAGLVTKNTCVVSFIKVRVVVVDTIEVTVKEDVVVVTLTLNSVEKKVLVVSRVEVRVIVEAIGIVTVVNSVTTSSSKIDITTRVGFEKSGVGVSGVHVWDHTKESNKR